MTNIDKFLSKRACSRKEKKRKKETFPFKPLCIVLVLCGLAYAAYTFGLMDVFSDIQKSQAMLGEIAYIFYILMFIAMIAGICSPVLGASFLLLWLMFGSSLAFSALVMESMESMKSIKSMKK